MFIVQPKGWWGGGQRYWSRESLHIFLFKGFQFFSVVYLGNIYARFFPPGNIQMWIFTQDIARHAPFLINPPEYRKILAMLLSPSINRYMCFTQDCQINSSSKTWAIGHIEGRSDTTWTFVRKWLWASSRPTVSPLFDRFKEKTFCASRQRLEEGFGAHHQSVWWNNKQ